MEGGNEGSEEFWGKKTTNKPGNFWMLTVFP